MANIPDFEYTAKYYWDILRSLELYRDKEVTGITEKSPYEPFNQALRAFALVAHLGSVTLDSVARESFLTTARLRKSVAALLANIGYQIHNDLPASVRMQSNLTMKFCATTQVIAPNARFATQGVGGVDPIVYECIDGLSIERNDRLTYVYCEDGGVYTDETANFLAGVPFTAWLAPTANDKIYFGHSDVWFFKLGLTFAVPSAGIAGVWEHYTEDLNQIDPSLVTKIGATLRFDINGLLGADDRTGSLVRVKINSTGNYEELYSAWDGTDNYILTSDYLGQLLPSTNNVDYTVGTHWVELESVDDKTLDMTVDETLEWEFGEPPNPELFLEYWDKSEVNSVEARWMRYRVVSAAGAVSPVISGGDITAGTHIVDFTAVQGLTIKRSEIGLSDGTPNQSIAIGPTPYIEGSARSWVDSDEWLLVDNFLASTPQSKHFTISVDDVGAVTFMYGDGVNGKIPPLIYSIEGLIRINAASNGNAGPYSIMTNMGGTPYLSSIRNMEAASGWTPKDGYDEDDLERLKKAGPAELRSVGKIVTKADAISAALEWETSLGVKPFSRAMVSEGFYGPKTSRISVVGTDGGYLISEIRTEFEDFLNGGSGALVNQRMIVDNYVKKTVDITATVTGGDKSTIENALRVYLDPLAKKIDGATWFWTEGTIVAEAKIISVIFSADQDVTDVTLTVPAGPITLSSDELPIAGTLLITVV